MFYKKNELEKREKFSIRKLAVGAASVMIGSVFFLNNGNVAHADELAKGDASANTEVVEKSTHQLEADESNDESHQIDSDDHSTASLDVNENQAPVKGINESKVEAADNTENPEAAKDSQKTEESPSDPTKGPDDYVDPEVEEAKKEAKAMPEVAIKGEMPELDARSVVNEAFKKANNLDVSIFEDPNNLPTVTWVKGKEPDVSKVGETKGTAVLSYQTYDDQGNPVTKKITIDNIPVYVRDGEKKKDGEVRNTINFVDQDSNKIVLSHTWVGEHSQSEYGYDSPVFKNDDGTISGSVSDCLKQSINLLGYTIARNDFNSDGSNNLDGISYFGKHDKVYNIVVTVPKLTDENDKPVDLPILNDVNDPDGVMTKSNEFIEGIPSFSQLAYNGVFNKDNIDPAEFIYGLGRLPEGEKVKWGGEEPKLENDKETDLPKLLNNPSIVIVGKDGKTVKTIKGDNLNREIIAAYSNAQDGPALSVQKLKVTQGDETPNAVKAFQGLGGYGVPSADILLKDSPELQTAIKDYQFSWVVAPDMSTPGYQIAFYRISKKNTANSAMVLMSLNAEPDENGGESIEDKLDALQSLVCAVLVYVKPKAATPQPNPDKKPDPEKGKDPQPVPTPQPDPQTPTIPESQPTSQPKEETTPTPTPEAPTNPTPVVTPKAPKKSQSKKGVNTKKVVKRETKGTPKRRHTTPAPDVRRTTAPVKAVGVKNVQTSTAIHQNRAQLPRTGEKTNKAVMIGLGLVAAAGLLGVACELLKKRS